MIEIRHYISSNGKNIFSDWLNGLRDKTVELAIDRRLYRIASSGHYGDHKFCRDGVWELRIDVGPGYRVYYGIAGKKVVLLLSGGDKRTQSKDIDTACEYWRDWQKRG